MAGLADALNMKTRGGKTKAGTRFLASVLGCPLQGRGDERSIVPSEMTVRVQGEMSGRQSDI